MTCSIIQKSELEGALRIDAEYYQPEYLKIKEILSGKNVRNLENISKSIINFGAYSLTSQINYLDEGVPFLQVGNIRDNFIEGKLKLIDEDLSKNLLKKSLVKDEQVLITIAGTIGNSVVAKNLPEFTNSNQAIANITLKDGFNPYYISTFLNSKYGKLQSQRLIISNVQPNLLLTQVKQLLIPVPSEGFQKKVAEVVKKADTKREKSKELYREAEEILLEELGLKDYEPTNENIAIVDLYEVKGYKRIDPEFFQPKYDEIIEAVKKYKGGFDTLENLSKLIGHPSNPPYEKRNTENKTFIITQKHLANYFPVDNFWKDEEALYTTDEFTQKNKKFILQKNDIILYSVGAYIGKANLYNAKIKSTIGSFLTIIRPKQETINPFYLLVFLNSKVGQALTRRNSRGLAQQYIYPYDTKQVIIPKLKINKQKEIESFILEGQKLYNLSKFLLEIAKKGVEMAIEKDEKEGEIILANK